MSFFKNVFQKGKEVVTNVITYWKKPAKGEYVSYKEVASYSLGGMGQMMVTNALGYLTLGAGSMLFGATLGLRPTHLQAMATILTVIQVFMAILRGKIVDNTRTKWGRFRPYIALGAVPLVILAGVFFFINFDILSYNRKLILSFVFGTVNAILCPFFADSFTELRTVISPNSNERAKVIMVSQVVASFAPTVVNLFVPILSDLTGGFTNIDTYRFVVLPVGIIGTALALFAAFGCKERIVMSESYVQKSNIFHDIVEVWKNKYWWIRNISSLVGFLESAYMSIFAWTFIYGTQNMTAYGIFTTLLGTASLISMLITPYVLRKLGNRRIMLVHNALNIVFIAFMCFTFTNWALFFIIYYLNTIANQLSIVYDPAIHSEVKDYQQYISDKRMDFTFGAAGQINLPITLCTAYVIPIVYEAMGVTTNYDIIYDPRVRYKFFYILCGLSVLGATLNLVPLFLYRLSREKHTVIITALRYRAVLEDYYLGGDIDPHRIKDLVESVNFIKEKDSKEVPDLKKLKREYKELIKSTSDNPEEIKAYKEALVNAKDLPKSTKEEKRARKIAIKAAGELLVTKNKRKAAIKNKYKEIQDADTLLNYKDGVNEIWKKELTKFDNDFERVKIACYEKILACEQNELKDIKIEEFEDCYKACLDMNIHSSTVNTDVSTEHIKNKLKIDKFYKKFIEKVSKMKEKIVKLYPSGEVIIPNNEDITKANELPETTKEERAMKRAEFSRIKKINDDYLDALGLYLEAKDKLVKYHASKLYPEIEKMYEQAVIDAAEIDETEKKKEEKEAAEKKEELARIRADKRSHKGKKTDEDFTADVTEEKDGGSL